VSIILSIRCKVGSLSSFHFSLSFPACGTLRVRTVESLNRKLMHVRVLTTVWRLDKIEPGYSNFKVRPALFKNLLSKGSLSLTFRYCHTC
jgi:hypothetical protein